MEGETREGGRTTLWDRMALRFSNSTEFLEGGDPRNVGSVES